MTEKYFNFFVLVLPITSVLLIPQIQGTTPGLVMALLSPFIIFTDKKHDKRRYLQCILIFIVIFILFLIASQWALILGNLGSKSNLVLIRPGPLEPLRITIFTQGLYLIGGFLTFLFFATYYNEKWDRFIIAGGVLLATIGLAEWIYFLTTGADFGFISNRTFGVDKNVLGSTVQTISVNGHSLLRLKSLTGEPSMYALTVFPYVAFCLARKQHLLCSYLVFTLLLSTSTSAFLGLLVFGLLMIAFYIKGTVYKTANLLLLVIFSGCFVVVFSDLIIQMVLEKLMLENVSGIDRFFNFHTNLKFWLDSGIVVKLFGIGWGTVRSTDMFTTLLVNTGVFGLLLWIYLFLKPMVKVKRKEPVSFILFLGLITVLLILFTAVPEYSYLTTWMFLGIIYSLTGKFNMLATTGCKFVDLE